MKAQSGCGLIGDVYRPHPVVWAGAIGFSSMASCNAVEVGE